MKVGIVGAGAMGSVYGGILGDAGNEVWVLDVWKCAFRSMVNAQIGRT